MCAKVVSLDSSQSDTKAGTLPTVSFVIPDLEHDMHGVGEGEDPVEVLKPSRPDARPHRRQRPCAADWTTGRAFSSPGTKGVAERAPHVLLWRPLDRRPHPDDRRTVPDLEPGTDPLTTTTTTCSVPSRPGTTSPYLGHAADTSVQLVASIVG